ncbi:SAM-dependent methyltransferase [Kaistia hirudinis]|uniref:SAM-dependent methyltransferase n=1 Tax=Kaistia hirudinis TaxID=1293440 RepID=A0A840ALQ2_9HYPH|nr:methyltransferase domain-containing protein [Kaistia hirudinis]MBB3929396.1 SAM-dependent methyltransferase [Kaistia hirudinis]
MPADVMFQGRVPELYDRLMVPLIFEIYAQDVAARVAALKPRDVVEIAAGTGAVTRELAKSLGPDTRVTVTDLSEPMLEVAQSRQAPDSRFRWQAADAMALPFADDSFDVAVCQFGVMLMPDRAAAYGAARRVLRPGGHYLFAVWDMIERNAFAAAVEAALADIFPGAPVDFLRRLPHGYYDAAVIKAELAGSGFADIAIDTVARTSRADTALAAATAYCQGTPIRGEVEARSPGSLAAVTERVAAAFAARFGDGPIEGPISALIVSGRKAG